MHEPGHVRVRPRAVAHPGAHHLGEVAPPGDGGGSGLAGMAERAALVGAELRTGPTPDGWRVLLRLPARTPDRERITT